jgi:Right handed beta helix region
MRKKWNASVVGLVVALAAPGCVFGVDGVILIDQSHALAGNVTPGDAPGFPVTISQPGSYKLSGNLTLPNTNTTAIEIAASRVTIDLNGLAIVGPNNCAFSPCSGSGYGIRTTAESFNVTIRNGTIEGMGQDGISLDGDAFTVEDMHVTGNGGNGITLGSIHLTSSLVQHVVARENGHDGIDVSSGLVSFSTASENGDAGIFIQGYGSAAHNVCSLNTGYGLLVGAGVNYIGNSLRDNNSSGGPQVSGGINHGQNVCGAVTCPGSQF